MDEILGSIKLTLVVWGLAALISFLVAGIIKLIFAAIRYKRGASTRAAAPLDAATDRPTRGA
ncbi:MAG: hypothetical protein A3H35_15055 [Betaproteobacteria bacterium RIFCSPLOWO2_02_FULL_62_17]|nr:MAG: hypothetical protein A3H35_15055 [Betaproteobacteria bacterium RIFCSPLOWO2_02_FULL_62_17]